MIATMIAILTQFKSAIILTISGIVGLFAYHGIKKSGEDNIKNKQTEEILNHARESKKINNNVTNLSDIDLDKRLQKFARNRSDEQE